ncbi:unnamed protein product [Alopecurus aequalis]
MIAPPSSDSTRETVVVSSPSRSPVLQLGVFSNAPARQSSSSESMANFPFDPTPFLPPERVALEVAGRPARVRVIHGDLRLSNEDLEIVTIVPMPQGEVAFQNVHEILGEFFAEKRVPIKSISKCPFGQAFVRFDSIEDRDWFVGNGPHACDDVHLIFQKHNEGMNWRKFDLNREVWIQIIGFPTDLRCMHELANSVKSFGKLFVWDRTKSTDAYALVKIGVSALSDIPTSTVVSGADRFSGESWTCPIVILQDNLLGGGPPVEDEVPVDGVPHPMPPEQFHHPNQNNHMIGPIPEHEEMAAHDVEVPVMGNQVNNHPVHMPIEEQVMENAVAWDQWAIQPAQEMMDMELHAGEFLELNDLMGPVVEIPEAQENDEELGSDLTLTINLPSDDDSHNSIQGPPLQNEIQIAPLLPHHFLDPNLLAHVDANIQEENVIANQVDAQAPALDLFPFPVEEEIQVNAVLPIIQNIDRSTDNDYVTHMSKLVLSTEINCNMIQSEVVATVHELQGPKGTINITDGADMENAEMMIEVSETGNILPNLNNVALATDNNMPIVPHATDIDSDAGIIGDEGVTLWKKHFAPKSDNDIAIQVPIEWVNFFTAALLSKHKFDWAKSFLATQLWRYIVEGTDTSSLRPFVIPDHCPISYEPNCKEYNMLQDQSMSSPDNTICAYTGTATTSAIHAQRKRKEKAPLVETEVRRSNRLQQLKKGFNKSTCQNNQCISCSARPPIIPAKIVKNLAVSFCKVDANDCSEEELHKKENKKKKVQKVKPQLQRGDAEDGKE